jgi:hypothetical protein
VTELFFFILFSMYFYFEKTRAAFLNAVPAV